MKRVIYILLALSVLTILGFKTVRESVRRDLSEPVHLPSPTSPQTSVQGNVKGVNSRDVERSVFVPYWGLKNGEIKDDYDDYLYFGLTPEGVGINKKEPGYMNLDDFLELVPEKSGKQLVLRMLNSDTTFPILKDAAKQSSLIRETISIARTNGFDGIVLDLEISAVPFDSLIAQVNQFTSRFYKEAKNSKLEFTLMLYGDTFYRLRPFDVKVLSKNADKFLIMSYDFHKSRGNPGPNFPLRGKEVYGYDMTGMTEDFLRYLPPEKTGVVFGLYGYDWAVDEKGTPISVAEAKSYQKIKQEFLNKCEYKNCDIKRKNDSFETEIRYTDPEGKNHIVWFEDMESVKAKEKYLRDRGIGTFSFWAYSYF
jgi:hypothetical protein